MSFSDILAGSPTLQERFATLSAEIITKVEQKYSVTLEPKDLLEFQGLKFAVLGNQPLDDTWMADAQTIKSVAAAEERQKLHSALQEANIQSAEHTAMINLLSDMKPADRLSYIRQNNLDSTSADTDVPTDAERGALMHRLSVVSSPTEKMAIARKMGQ